MDSGGNIDYLVFVNMHPDVRLKDVLSLCSSFGRLTGQKMIPKPGSMCAVLRYEDTSAARRAERVLARHLDLVRKRVGSGARVAVRR